MMESTYKLNSIVLWIIAVICFSIALFTAIEHTTHFFANHNFLFSPFADDILDNAFYSYPMATGKIPYTFIFEPYIDHRIAIERIQEVLDFLFTNGVQSAQPYRLSIILWGNFLLFSYFVIFSNSRLTAPIKLLLSSAYLMFIFAGMSINNYISTMQITWPFIYLFTLLSFICAEKYCRLLDTKSNTTRALLFILFTSLFVNLTLFTFNIGTILWPIILLLLIKRNCFRQHCLIWITFALLSYFAYISPHWVLANWHSYTQHTNSTAVFNKPFDVFFYLSRALSMPFVKQAFTQYSVYSLIIGLFAALSSLVIIVYFLRLKKWSSADTVFFSYFIFILLANLIISAMRCDSGKTTLIEWRFLTSSLLLQFCILMSLFYIRISSNMKQKAVTIGLSVLTAIGLILFIRLDAITSGGTYDVGFFNQVYISEAIGIPINEHFLQASNIYQSSGVLFHHVSVNDVQKKYKKGPFSFWASQFINHSINELPFTKVLSENQANLNVIYDYRLKQSPAVLINARLDHYHGPINNNYEVIFTSDKQTIVGFAISAPYLQSLLASLQSKNKAPLLWRGAVNTDLLHNTQTVYAWAVLPKEKIMYQLGKISIHKPLQSQIEPSWIWQKTSHFGI